MKSKAVFLVVRTEGQYEATDYPVRAFDDEPTAKAFAESCKTTFKRQHELFVVNRARYGEDWWSFDVKKTDAIEARYERPLPDRCCIRNSDVSWCVYEVPYGPRR